MAEPVRWSDDGTPHSPRFDDRYRSTTGALAQARHVFLGGCGLPAAWAGAPRWTVLETGFGLGLNFLATWQAWRDDPQRPALLHMVSCEAFPVAREDILRAASAEPQLAPLGEQLAQRWWGLVPGQHRFVFEDGRVVLTLCIGDVRAVLAEQAFAADSVFLDGFDPQANPAMWELGTLKAVTRLCRLGAGLASWTVNGQVRRDLRTCGFVVEKAPGLPPKRECLQARYQPAWTVRGGFRLPSVTPTQAVVVGAGLAGAAVAAQLALRGWQVQVLDAGDDPAAGASGLPAGLLAPHATPDDNLLSRIVRAGLRLTWQACDALLQTGQDWAPAGVRQRREDARPLPDLGDFGSDWQQPDAASGTVWFPHAGWVKPAALVRAWLDTPGIRFTGQARVAALCRSEDGAAWQARDAQGDLLAQAPLLVVCAALGSAALAPAPLLLHAVRGQVSRGPCTSDLPLPPTPVNGAGHLLPSVPFGEAQDWLCGATYGRADTATDVRAADHAANLDRLRQLTPALAQALGPAFAQGQVQAWTGVRCASADRRPLVGELAPGLWCSVALGSRGLSFAALAAQLLAARLHGEPLPLPQRLAQALDVARLTR